jgi:fatty acid-binding protein DegV
LPGIVPRAPRRLNTRAFFRLRRAAVARLAGARAGLLFERFESDVAARGFAQAFVQHADAAEGAQQLADRVSILSGQDTPVWPLGATIGVHVGPGTVALA